MSIWGSRPRVTSQGSGTFHCPSCDRQSTYSDQKVQRYYAVFSISLFPAAPAGGYIECTSCKGTFARDVLSYDPKDEIREFQANFESALLNAMILMMVSDGNIADKEVESVCSIYQEIAGRALSARAVRARAADIRHGGGLNVYLEDTASELNAHGRSLVMQALCMIAAADGVLAPEEDALLADASRVLGVPSVAVAPMIAEMQAT